MPGMQVALGAVVASVLVFGAANSTAAAPSTNAWFPAEAVQQRCDALLTRLLDVAGDVQAQIKRM